jgi:hypothetical protein
MGDDPEPLTTEAEPRRTNRGILAVMFAVVAAMAVAGAAIYGIRAAIGVVVGGLMAWLNFRWLDSSTRAIMVDPTTAKTPILAMKYVFRYVLIAAVLYAIWWADVLPVAAVIAGLGSFAIAVLIRGLKSIITSSQ